jgi:hypothetical protein
LGGDDDGKQDRLQPCGRLSAAILPFVSGGTWATKSRHNLRGGVIGKLVGEGHGEILPHKKKSAMRKIILAKCPQCVHLSLVRQPHKKMKKPLSYFRHMTRKFIAKLDGMKHIMRVETPRKAEWYLVLPARGDEDATCVLLKKVTLSKYYYHSELSRAEDALLEQYADRITA